MSATNRDTLRPGDDYYATPAWTVDALLAKLSPTDGDAWWIDPGCGDGAIMERMIMTAEVSPGFIVGVENDAARATIARERFPYPFSGGFHAGILSCPDSRSAWGDASIDVAPHGWNGAQ